MQIIYHPKVKSEDIPRMSPDIVLRIKTIIEQRLITDPFRYGFFLHGSLHGYRKLRVGDYRVIYRIVGEQIRIIVIGHRKDVYSISKARILKGGLYDRRC